MKLSSQSRSDVIDWALFFIRIDSSTIRFAPIGVVVVLVITKGRNPAKTSDSVSAPPQSTRITQPSQPENQINFVLSFDASILPNSHAFVTALRSQIDCSTH
jgi:hypothetical protein